MRIRYITGKNGRLVKKAIVYTQNEHGINFADVDTDAVYIIEKLRACGYETYIVGGAVRDLMLGKKPKDFDIVSGASPSRIKKTFRNARIIGRRFRLVHVYFGPKTFEVSTFRSLKDGPTSNTFGAIEEDVLRRDFSLNALFYDPVKQVVVDYVGGMKDIRNKWIRPIIPLSVIFRDDPVRMIRAVKYAATTGFKLPLRIKWKIKRQSSLLASIPSSRLTEELFKIIHSASAFRIVESLEFFGLYEYLQPKASALLKKNSVFRTRYMKSLGDLSGSESTGAALAALIRDYLEDFVDWDGGIMENYKNAFYGARQFVLPINPPRADLDHAVRIVFGEHGMTVKKSRFIDRGKSWFPIVETPGPVEIPGGDPPKKRRRRKGRSKGGSGEGGPEEDPG
ncbi:MAG: polynucleotide adenylyltransferase PcnB [Spirochaetaceae bacterium]|jgi:poly(A) polymerase|nr:polynucleotide adenylyltransferase PcnB [Spirochaetaceae bacterium]